MRIVARAATDGDVADITFLVEAAIDEKRGQRGGPIWATLDAPQQPVDSVIAGLLAADDETVIVGTINEIVLGLAALRVVPLHDGDAIAELHLLYVEPEARGVGVGEALMNAAVEWSEAQECVGIDSVALPGDRDTKNFFESFGLVARQITVHRPIGRQL